jgi:hypothetical protein
MKCVGIDSVGEHQIVEVEVVCQQRQRWRGTKPVAEFRVETVLGRLNLGQTDGRSPMAHGIRHAREQVIEVVIMERQPDETRVSVMVRMSRRHLAVNRGVGSGNHLHMVTINVTDGIGPRSHRGSRAICTGGVSIGHAILSSSALGRSAAR